MGLGQKIKGIKVYSLPMGLHSLPQLRCSSHVSYSYKNMQLVNVFSDLHIRRKKWRLVKITQISENNHTDPVSYVFYIS